MPAKGLPAGAANQVIESQLRRVEELEALRAILADITSELELPKLLQAILERAVDLLNASGGDLGLLKESPQGEMEIVVSHNMGKNYTGTLMKAGEGAMGRAVALRQTVTINDYGSWEDRSPQYDQGPYHAVLAEPLILGPQVMGAVGVVDENPCRIFTMADQRLLTLFAQQATIAVNNARLYQSARRLAERSEILHRASQDIVAASSNPEGIYAAIHHAAHQLMPAEAFAITMLDREQHQVRAVYLVDRRRRVPVSIPAGSGLSSWVIRSGKSIYIEDTQFQDSILTQENIEAVHFGDPVSVRSVLAVPMRLGEQVIGMLSAQSYQPKAYAADDLTLLEMLASHAAIALENARLFSKVQQLAITDPLTGISNRRQLFELGEREFSRARRFKRPLSVIMIDLDHFKLINDSYGHPTGDKVLVRIAQLLQSNIRDIDIIGRYGGEEFTIILPETDVAAAAAMAERLRVLIEATPIELRENLPPREVTISLGVATIQGEMQGLLDLIERSDEALYLAKRGGRNRVVMAPERHKDA